MHEDNMTHIFHSGQPSHGDDFNLTKRNLDSVASLFATKKHFYNWSHFRDIGGINYMLYLEFIWVNKENKIKIVFFMDKHISKKA
jgi:hypothetical protein